MKNWLDFREIEYGPRALKPQLCEIIKQNKPAPFYKADELKRAAGHDTLRLPPYHYNLNPIELVWSDLKGEIGLQHSTFKLEEVRRLVNDSTNG